MTNQLSISFGQYSCAGNKSINQDFIGCETPAGSALVNKGIAFAMADGISSSDVSHIASETAVKTFLADYYCTSEAWSVKNAACKVISATNSWLYSQTRRGPNRFDLDRGHVCTLSALVFKSHHAHVFHIGDTRVYRLTAEGLEQLTNDHRLWVSEQQSHLSRAMGIAEHCEIDYQSLRLSVGEVFVIATDGVYEFVDAQAIQHEVNNNTSALDVAAKNLVDSALSKGSDDNLSIQIIRIDALPEKYGGEVQQQIETLPFAPQLEARTSFDGYTIIRELHASSRSHVYLALDDESNQQVVIKVPSVDMRGDPDYLERFLMEEWIARRINSAYVLKANAPNRQRNFLYTVSEYIEGKTLSQWMTDNPQPNLDEVRGIIDQLAKGLRAFHRMEMLHQDLKPGNIIIDANGTVKIIDFGSTRVAGLAEHHMENVQEDILGTALFTAPEYFLGEQGTTRSELFSLGVICYALLSGRYPYGTRVAGAKTAAAQKRLQYQSVINEDSVIPRWVDFALKKAVEINPYKRYGEISEFIYDLHHPNQRFLNREKPPLLERNPVAFWQGLCLILMLIIVVQAIR